jgi:integrase
VASITKKGDRKYLIRVSKGTGKGRTYDNRVFRGTLADARTLARQMESDMDSGLRRESQLAFADYLELWLKAVAPKLAPRTLDGYEGYIKRYALAPLAKFKLAEIRNHHIQQIYLSIGKSPGTVRQLHATLNACFSWALKKEYIANNPCRNLDLPRKQRREMQVMTAEEARRFVDVCRKMPNGVIFEFALETGMRPEEYLALRWSDITGREVSINQVVQFNRKGGGFYFAEPKTEKSRRMISISENLEKALIAHRRKQNEHRISMKGTWYNLGLVFPDTIGRPIPLPNLTRRYLAPILKKCDFGRHFKLYSLRHSCATLLMMAGYNAKIVADRLGHASTSMTMDVYSHVLPHIQNEATNALDKIMRTNA